MDKERKKKLKEQFKFEEKRKALKPEIDCTKCEFFIIKHDSPHFYYCELRCSQLNEPLVIIAPLTLWDPPINAPLECPKRERESSKRKVVK